MAKRIRRRDPISDYREWVNHRYDPGHYLGGNVPPYLKNLSSPGLGRAMLLNGVLSVGVVMAFVGWARGNGPLAIAGVVVGVGWLIGTAVVRTRRHRGAATDRSRR